MKRLTIYYALRGTHVHCRMFVDGSKSGDLVMQDKEFTAFRELMTTGHAMKTSQWARGAARPPDVEFKDDGEIQVDLRVITESATEPEVRSVAMDHKEFQAVKTVVDYVRGLRGDLGGFFHLDIQRTALGMVGLAFDFVERTSEAIKPKKEDM